MPKKKRSKRGRRRGWGGYLLSFLLGSVVTLGIYTLVTQEKPPLPTQKRASFESVSPKPPPPLSPKEKAPPKESVSPPKVAVSRPPVLSSPSPRAKIAIVIDDLGRENHISHELLQWDLPVTFSILPFEPHSRDLARAAHQRGKEVLLHLPLEPHGYPKTKPGEGALLLEMNETGLLHQLSTDIEAVPYIKGVSNHMGSRFMEDSRKMKVVLSELKNRKLFFLDSGTTSQSVGLQTASSIGLEAAQRTVFLDHEVSEEAIRRSLDQLVRVSLLSGKAIGIGHPHEATLKNLRRMIPEMHEKGIKVVPLSVIMEENGSK